jgi:branched-chain amino acid transport system substrate-binding protein
LSSQAITKIHSLILIAVIIVAAVGGVTAYILLSGEDQSFNPIKIGILTDIDGVGGRHIWQGAVLAAEHLNSEGGILGRQVEVIGEDTDYESSIDMLKINSALTRLLTHHDVDFVIGLASGAMGYMIQDVIAEHKKIYMACGAIPEGLTQRVIDDYDKYKYFFHEGQNSTVIVRKNIKMLLHAREITGFDNVGYLSDDHAWNAEIREGLDNKLPELGFNLVYRGTFPPFDTFDFSSYFAAAETAEVEILVPQSIFNSGISLVKEYYNRQSPMIIFGGLISQVGFIESWEQTDGKCIYTTMNIQGVTVGYPITSKTMPFHDSYIERWGVAPFFIGASSHDIIRFILFDALERAGTTETEEVIKALEETDVETTRARKFAFTTSHDVLYTGEIVDNPDDYGIVVSLFQWQEEGALVPIYPKWLMEEAGATYTFPDWPGPWDK